MRRTPLYIVSTSHICGLVLLSICHCECETASQDENKEKGQSSRVSQLKQNIRDKKVLFSPSLCSPDVWTGPLYAQTLALKQKVLPIKDSGMDGEVPLFWKSQVLPEWPLSQHFLTIPDPWTFTRAHACQRPIFMDRSESWRPPVVSLHSAKKFQFLS